MSWQERILSWRANPEAATQAAKIHVLESEEFEAAIWREWSRGERIGMPLSLVTIGCQERNDLVDMAALLGRRIRCTDIIGWYKRGGIGLLLPHTSGEAAWTLINDIQSQMEGRIENGNIQKHFQYGVYTHPLQD